MKSLLLSKIANAKLSDYPFPHLIINDFLPLHVFRELESILELRTSEFHGSDVSSNKLILSSVFGPAGALKSDLSNQTSADVRQALSLFTLKEVWFTILRIFNVAPRHDWSLSWRGLESNEGSIAPGLEYCYEVQFGFNTPVTRGASRVRGIHVDHPQKLFNGLIYFRSSTDDCSGGDLGLYRFRSVPKLYYVNALDLDCELVKVIPYQPNTLVIMKNSSESLHGVIERPVCPHYRKYININLSVSEEVFQLDKYQASKFRHEYVYSRYLLHSFP